MADRDWITTFLEYTVGIPSPDIFRLWSAIACVAGTLERRVWMQVSGKILYPNLYTILVSDPGIGKTQAIEHAHDFWYKTPGLHIAPHDVTKAALVDEIAGATRKMILNETQLVEYNSLLVAADEFGVLVPAHDLDFLSTLNRIYDNPPQHRQNRRGLKEQIDITNPQLNIVAGTQPAYLANLLPEQAWGMGFMSRVIMVHSATKRRVRLFGGTELNKTLHNELLTGTKKFSKLYGAMNWDYQAAALAEKWNMDGLEPVPEHSKLEHYNARRLLHVLKLSIISAVSAGNATITVSDFNRARDWLLGTEQTMPEVFRAMVQRSDMEVINELHFYIWNLYVKAKSPIHESRLIHFLQTRTTSDKVDRILALCVKSNIFDFDPSSKCYVPRPRNQHGME